MKWQHVEDRVRAIASYLYGAPAKSETINGVKCDCVVKVRSDYWIVVEITKENTLGKLREDLAKFASVRPFLLGNSIYAECIFVCQDSPPPSLVDTGRGANVEVIDVAQFGSKFLDYANYYRARVARVFGSAINPFTGSKDEHAYIPVQYKGVTFEKKLYTLSDIAQLLRQKKTVVLLGNYGTGKSRCVQELFSTMGARCDHSEYVLSIDLRDNWGIRRAHELLRRHFDDLGLSHYADNVLKILSSDNLIFLIDGFDEIGSQSWSDDASVLRDIRRKSLAAVKDLVTKTRGAILITGRQHYFNTDAEMFECLGVSPSSSVVLQCREEFSDAEMAAYFTDVEGEALELPTWLPKRPLVCQVLNELDSTAKRQIIDNSSGEIIFWNTLLSAICDREAKINPVLDAAAVQSVLVRLARITRTKPQNVGPLSVVEINQAFHNVTGFQPVDESAVMLQRLPLLGRIGPESTDRQFVDMYFLDGLRAEDLNRVVFAQDMAVADEPWINTLLSFGLRVVRAELEASVDDSAFALMMRRASERRNRIMAGEIATVLLDANNGDYDFAGLILFDANVTYLDLSDSSARRLTVEQSIIDRLDITNANVAGVTIRNCMIRTVDGVAESSGLPEWMRDAGNDIESFRSLSTTSRIKAAPLSLHQRIFVAIIKKTFFQPGSGRKEEALTRGLGRSVERKAVTMILKLLVEQDILRKVKGKEGNLYTPNRAYTKRMDDILTTLTLSDDALWKSLPGDVSS